jgi:hypothetical protein
MSKATAIVLTALLALAPASVLGGDGDKPAAPKPEKKAKDDKKKEEKKKEERGGNAFVNFWVHTVGGTIGNGLKKGAGKIERAFD